MERFCKNDNIFIGTRGCDLVALDPAAIIFTPKRLPSAFATTYNSDPVEAIKTLIYGDLATQVKGCPIIYDETLTPTDNSEGAVIGSYGAGFQTYIRGGNMIYQFDLPQKFCKSKKMLKLNNWDGGVIFLTKDKRVVFGDLINGEYIPFSLVTNYIAPKMFDNKVDPTLMSIFVNLGELDNVYPKTWVSEAIDDLFTLDLEGVIEGTITFTVQTAASISFYVEDACTGLNISDATYQTSSVPGVTIRKTDSLGAVDMITTATILNGIITATPTTPDVFADGDVIEVLNGVQTGADDGADYCMYYAKSSTIDVTP